MCASVCLLLATGAGEMGGNMTHNQEQQLRWEQTARKYLAKSREDVSHLGFQFFHNWRTYWRRAFSMANATKRLHRTLSQMGK